MKAPTEAERRDVLRQRARATAAHYTSAELREWCRSRGLVPVGTKYDVAFQIQQFMADQPSSN